MIEALQRRIDDAQLPYDKCGADTDVQFFAFSYRRLMRLKKPRVLLIHLNDAAFLSAMWYPQHRHFRAESFGRIYELDAVRRVFGLIDPFGLHQADK